MVALFLIVALVAVAVLAGAWAVAMHGMRDGIGWRAAAAFLPLLISVLLIAYLVVSGIRGEFTLG